jgi:hypothetical protein
MSGRSLDVVLDHEQNLDCLGPQRLRRIIVRSGSLVKQNELNGAMQRRLRNTPAPAPRGSGRRPDHRRRPCVARGFRRSGVSGLASMYPVSDWSCFAPDHYGYQRACDLIVGQTSRGQLDQQCSHAPGRPIPSSVLIPSQTSAGMVGDYGGDGEALISDCRRGCCDPSPLLRNRRRCPKTDGCWT